jgi:CheY-like chemotaxis protein
MPVHTEQTSATHSSLQLHASAMNEWLESKTRQNNCQIRQLLEAPVWTGVSTDSRPKHLGPRRVVVVDDEAVVAITLAEILRRRDYRAVWFTQSVRAQAFMDACRPDLLIYDVTTPAIDELELASNLRSSYPDCPILFLSAIVSSRELEQRLGSLGPNLVLARKPVQISNLLRGVSSLVNSFPE